jgi:hypothetical protein
VNRKMRPSPTELGSSPKKNSVSGRLISSNKP